jgi:copper transport protein
MLASRRFYTSASPISALVVALIGLALAAASVSAHVALVAATPVPGSTIGQPPKAIRIRFDQVPDPKFNEITLLDTSGKSVAGGAATAEAGDPSVIEVTLSANLAPGLYTVAWQALANDGHLTKGNYSFTLASGLGPAPPLEPQSIGAPTAGGTANASALSGSGNPSVLAVIVRWWRYLALGVLIGAFGLAVIVLRPATMTLDDSDAAWRRAIRMLRPWVFGSLVAFILAHLATLIVQAATVADISVLAVRGDTLRRLAYNTTYGAVWRVIAVVAVLFLIGMLATLLPFWRARPPTLGVIATARPGARAVEVPDAPAEWPWRVGLAVALLLAVELTFSSHAIESQHQPVLAILADAAHLSAMGLWFGGLLVLLVTLRRSLRPLEAEVQTAYLTAAVGRFSNLALASVACLIATGLYAMTLHTTRTTILNTSYGQTLLIKHALIVPLIVTAALNLRVIKPRLGDEARARRWLPRLLGIEAALGLLVLLVTATLTQLPPAHLLTGANAALADPRLTNAVAVAPPTSGQQADLNSGPQSAEMQDAAGMTVLLLSTTGKDGSALDANIVDPTTSQPLADVQRVTALITFSGADLGQTSVLLPRDASGHYRATGIFFPIKGVWNIQLVIRRENVAEDARLNFSFTSDPARFQATEPPASAVTAARTGFLWPRLLPNAWLGLLLALVGAALFALTYPSRFRATLRGRTRTAYRAWSIGALLVGVIVFGYNSTDRTPTTGIANPLPNDTATLARGQQLFAQNCAICHGAGGKGDGPLGQNLNPRPVDLTGSHLTTHTDGDLYWWIGHGIAGTGMPSFTGTLSDQDIWAIIRYVRSLHGMA